MLVSSGLSGRSESRLSSCFPSALPQWLGIYVPAPRKVKEFSSAGNGACGGAGTLPGSPLKGIGEWWPALAPCSLFRGQRSLLRRRRDRKSKNRPPQMRQGLSRPRRHHRSEATACLWWELQQGEPSGGFRRSGPSRSASHHDCRTDDQWLCHPAPHYGVCYCNLEARSARVLPGRRWV